MNAEMLEWGTGRKNHIILIYDMVLIVYNCEALDKTATAITNYVD